MQILLAGLAMGVTQLSARHTAGARSVCTPFSVTLLVHGRQWSVDAEKARGPQAAPTPAPWPHEHPASPTRAGQKTRLFQKEFLRGEEGLLCHEQRVFGLGHALRRQEAGLRGHGGQTALKVSLRCGARAGTLTWGRVQVLEASFMAFRMLPEKVERVQSQPRSPGLGRGLERYFL